jgi:hypothetical protein
MDQSNMLEGPHDLNGFGPGGDLKDGTAASRAGGTGGSLTVIHSTGFGPTATGPEPSMDTGGGPVRASAADLDRGFVPLDAERTPMFDDGSGESPIGDSFSFGGFLGRQRGTTR